MGSLAHQMSGCFSKIWGGGVSCLGVRCLEGQVGMGEGSNKDQYAPPAPSPLLYHLGKSKTEVHYQCIVRLLLVLEYRSCLEGGAWADF